MIKNAKKSFFISEKIKKYQKCPALPEAAVPLVVDDRVVRVEQGPRAEAPQPDGQKARDAVGEAAERAAGPLPRRLAALKVVPADVVPEAHVGHDADLLVLVVGLLRPPGPDREGLPGDEVGKVVRPAVHVAVGHPVEHPAPRPAVLAHGPARAGPLVYPPPVVFGVGERPVDAVRPVLVAGLDRVVDAEKRDVKVEGPRVARAQRLLGRHGDWLGRKEMVSANDIWVRLRAGHLRYFLVFRT